MLQILHLARLPARPQAPQAAVSPLLSSPGVPGAASGVIRLASSPADVLSLRQAVGLACWPGRLVPGLREMQSAQGKLAERQRAVAGAARGAVKLHLLTEVCSIGSQRANRCQESMCSSTTRARSEYADLYARGACCRWLSDGQVYLKSRGRHSSTKKQRQAIKLLIVETGYMLACEHIGHEGA